MGTFTNRKKINIWPTIKAACYSKATDPVLNNPSQSWLERLHLWKKTGINGAWSVFRTWQETATQNWCWFVPFIMHCLWCNQFFSIWPNLIGQIIVSGKFYICSTYRGKNSHQVLVSGVFLIIFLKSFFNTLKPLYGFRLPVSVCQDDVIINLD